MGDKNYDAYCDAGLNVDMVCDDLEFEKRLIKLAAIRNKRKIRETKDREWRSRIGQSATYILLPRKEVDLC